jgi:prepilin-type processing-associated H-X9-DG protein
VYPWPSQVYRTPDDPSNANKTDDSILGWGHVYLTFMKKNRDAFRSEPLYGCPTVQLNRLVTGPAGMQYGMNRWFNPVAHGVPTTRSLCYKPTDVNRPSEIILFGDRTLRQWMWQLDNTDVNYFPDARHSRAGTTGSANFVFVDGHAEGLKGGDRLVARHYNFAKK